MTVNFSSNHIPHRMPSHRQPSKAVGRKVAHSSDNQLLSFRSKLIIALVAGPTAMFSWVAHVGHHALLKGDIQSKSSLVSVFEGKSSKLEKLKKALNKGFEPDSAQKPFRLDTVLIPDNVTDKPQNNFLKNVKAVFTTPPLVPSEVKESFIKLEDSRRYQNFDTEVPPYFDVRVGEGIFWDENGKKYLPIEYYSK